MDAHPFPSELLSNIIQYAAKDSPTTACTLLQVSRWTRDIALKALYSVLVILPLSLDIQTPALHYMEDQSANVLTTSFEKAMYMLLEVDSPLARTLAVQREPHLPHLLPPSDLPHSLWLSGGVKVINRTGGYFTFTGYMELQCFCPPLIRYQGKIQHLAIDVEAIANFWVNDLLQDAPNVRHLKLVDYQSSAYIPSMLYSRHKGDALLLIAASKAAHGRGAARSVTHFEAGTILNFFPKSTPEQDVALIFSVFPNLTHIAFILYIKPSLHRGIWELSVRVLLMRLLIQPGLQNIRLVIRDPQEVARYYDDKLAPESTVTKAELVEIAKAMVEQIPSPRLSYIIAPPGPEWALWKTCCEEGGTIWDIIT